nr:hypothetical protein [uncultured Actinoplanes sp.]
MTVLASGWRSAQGNPAVTGLHPAAVKPSSGQTDAQPVDAATPAAASSVLTRLMTASASVRVHFVKMRSNSSSPMRARKSVSRMARRAAVAA